MSTAPYSPMLLANGVDSMLIDWGGSIRCCDKGLECHDRFWFKADRRNAKGELCPLFYTGYMLVANGEHHLVRGFKQKFDPKRALLKTWIEAAGFRARIETFLTQDHLLVEHFEILAVPEPGDDCGIELVLSKPDRRAEELEIALRWQPELNGVTASYSSSQWHGCVHLTCDRQAVSGEAGAVSGLSRDPQPGARMVIGGLHPGMAFTVAVFAADTLDTPDPELAVAAARERLATGFAAVKTAHVRFWQKYQRQSDIKLPESELNYLFHLGNWLIKASQHPVSGGTPSGMLPLLWQGKIFWDSCFMHDALLGANRMAEAERLARFWLRTLPMAQQNARQWRQPGARFGWCTDHHGYCDLATTIKEFHNNPVVALMVFAQYQATGNLELLREFFPVMREALDFMLAQTVCEDAHGAVIDRCEGVDESHRNQRINDTWTAGVTVAALEKLLEAARLLGVVLEGRYRHVYERLRLGLDQNCDASGVLLSARGASSASFGSMLYLLLPEHRSRSATMGQLWWTRGEFNTVCHQGVPRQDARDVPWFTAWAAAIEAERGDAARAMVYLRQVLRCAGNFGALPEQIRPDGLRYKPWMATAHAALLMAVRRLLVSTDGERIRICPAVPAEWRDYSFRNLRVNPGLLVTAKVEGGKFTTLEIVNDTSHKIVRTLKIPRRREHAITIEPGAAWTLR